MALPTVHFIGDLILKHPLALSECLREQPDGWSTMNHTYLYHLEAELQQASVNAVPWPEPVISHLEGAIAVLQSGQRAINLCSGDYLGLAGDQRLIDAATQAMAHGGYGSASCRPVSGTRLLHLQLENLLAEWLGADEAMLFPSAADACLNIFDVLLGAEDAIIFDEFVHAFAGQGIRLSHAQRFSYSHNNLHGLEAQLQAATTAGARFKMIVTDGVFPMSGCLATLPGIVELAQRYGALLMVNDVHGTGLLGERGEGAAGHFAVAGQVDIHTGSLGEALGGVTGGYLATTRPIAALLRQCADNYRFATTLPPAMCAASMQAIQIISSENGQVLRQQALQNACHVRRELELAGFRVTPGLHPIVSIMIGDVRQTADMATLLLEEGVLTGCFGWPQVPHGRARLRVQMSALHDAGHIEQTLRAFVKAGRCLALIQ